MLAELPPEVLAAVAQQLTKADLKSLSLVSVYTRRVAVPYLWASITIGSPHEIDLADIRTKEFPDSRIPHASGLCFAAPFQLVYAERCPHFYSQDTEQDYSSSEAQEDHVTNVPHLERLGQRTRSALNMFEKDQLRSFSWDMGCCVPETILGPKGLLSLLHPSLESLRLVTDPTCYFNQHSRFTDRGEIDLSPFRNLRSICWKGPVDRDHHTLDTVIKNNAGHLDHLELDLLDWWKETPDDYMYPPVHVGDKDPGYFGNVLKLHQHAPQPILQNLTSLMLAHAPLGPAMAGMINFDVLRSLTLRLCPDWTLFTKRIIKLGVPVRLKMLELHHDTFISSQVSQSEVEDFIDVCRELEELFLNLPRPVRAWSLWKHISDREASLKRLVLHHRTSYRNEMIHYGEEVDLTNLGLAKHEVQRLKHYPLRNPLRNLKLECMSLCCFPDFVRSILKFSSSIPSLKLIHIRQTGRDLKVFGSMAVDRGSRLIDTYELNNRDQDYDYAYFIDPPKAKKANLDPAPEPKTPPPIKLQEGFRSLAEWAFGSEGPPLLEAIAYGDFAHDGRANKENLILCRGPDGFRMVPRDGYEWMGIVDKYRSVLEACPTKLLLKWCESYAWESDW